MEGGFKWTRANEDVVATTDFTVTSLKADKLYEYRIAAENRAGVGPASDPTAPVVTREPVCTYPLSPHCHRELYYRERIVAEL